MIYKSLGGELLNGKLGDRGATVAILAILTGQSWHAFHCVPPLRSHGSYLFTIEGVPAVFTIEACGSVAQSGSK